MIELNKDSRFEYGNIAITFQRLAIINPILLHTYFVANNQLILSDESVLIVKKIRNKIKNKILALDKYRKEKDQERRNKVYYPASTDYHESYNTGYRKTSYLLYGI